jgi:TRAP-type C4-dicarboxylate transport system permease small subunit
MINLGWVSKLSKICSLFCGYLLLGLCFLILAEVIGRKFFSFSFQGVDEIGGYLVAISGSFAFGFGVLEKAHTRIDIALAKFPIHLRNFFNVSAYLAIFLVSAFLARYSFVTLSESILFKSISATPLEVPIRYPQFFWFVGLSVFSLISFLALIKIILSWMNDPAQSYKDFGPESLNDEVNRELEDVKKRKTLR